MPKSSRMLLLVAVLAFGVSCGFYLQSPAVAQEKPKEKAPSFVTKWEYRIVMMGSRQRDKAETELNALGEQGFEITFVTSNSLSEGRAGDMSSALYYTLKRAKQ